MSGRVWHSLHAALAMGVVPGAAFWRLYGLQDNRNVSAPPIKLAPRGLQHPILCRPATSDMWVCWQVLVERMFNCLDDLESVDLIIDCGANTGFSAAWFLSRFPRARVVAVEPDRSNFALLKANLEPYGARATAIHGAVWSTRQRLTISDPSAAAFAIQVRAPAETEVGDIQAYSIPDLLEIAGTDHAGILKLDIEGSEAEVFREPPSWLGRFDHIAIELHGEVCRKVFMEAISHHSFSIAESKELTVCTRKRSGE
jgi:FkbM family methyltransferase